MKSKILFSAALLAFFLGLAILAASWNGNFSIKAAWPISSSVVELSGNATGWRAMAGFAGLPLALVLFLWGLITLVTRPLRRQAGLPAPPPEPDPEVKKQAASQ